MNLLEVIRTTVTDMNIVSAITSTLFIIMLGYFCRKKGIFNDQVGKILSKVVLTVALPALAFNAFMQDIDERTLSEGINILIWGLAIYIILIVLTKPMYMKFKGDQQDTLRILTIFGSTTFFGIPIVGAIYGAEGVLYASIFNIGYRIFLYSYGYIKMSGLKMETRNIKEMFLNPIVLATFAGLFIWMFQSYIPQVTVSTEAGVASQVAFLRIDQTAVWLHKPLTYLAGLASPLAWLAIGATLGSVDFKSAMTNKVSWFYSFNKIIMVPSINIVLLLLLNFVGIMPLSGVLLGTVVIMMATPTATVCAAYAISFDKDAVLASNASLLSTLSAVILIPIWIIIINTIGQIFAF
ncbi:MULTISPECIES: AEC family transporter [Bacillaceae]|uniref:AEC family transporter n=2 Tax=Bacillaceae TaxID=186817 RepID=A0A7V7RQS1_9BACI|nr:MULTISPECIES: AEC family transporter [Bacillaceae]KAB2335788.1 AEC family transporter [Bacillus mesophilum]QVY59736.1 AEC family transporter [Cytobacillus gottheilii]